MCAVKAILFDLFDTLALLDKRMEDSHLSQDRFLQKIHSSLLNNNVNTKFKARAKPSTSRIDNDLSGQGLVGFLTFF